jgi:hypothetical protein
MGFFLDHNFQQVETHSKNSSRWNSAASTRDARHGGQAVRYPSKAAFMAMASAENYRLPQLRLALILPPVLCEFDQWIGARNPV